MVALPPGDGAKVGVPAGLAGPVAGLPAQAECLSVAACRLLVAPLPLVDDTEVGHGDGLTNRVADLD